MDVPTREILVTIQYLNISIDQLKDKHTGIK